MAEEIINFDLPVERSSIIKVVGIGGGGNNAVNHMYRKGIKDVNFIICNTDYQALVNSPVPVKIQIGESITEGMGAGSRPEKGRQAALENLDDIMKAISGNTKMVFITTGMGGGTGTGATPVVAKACKEAGYLTVAVVTIPFKSEGKAKIRLAIDGVNELKDHVDSLLVINNEKLREIYGDLPVSAAFAKADDVLTTAVKGIAEIITVTGYINVDFADVETVMKDSGVAFMGMGMVSGENRAIRALENALSSPLLNSNDVTGAKSILVNILTGSGENELTMDELGEITDYLYDVASDDAMIIRGLSIDPSLKDEISVTVVATGFEPNSIFQPYKPPKPEIVTLNSQNNPQSKHDPAVEFKENFVIYQKPRQLILLENDDPQRKIDFGLFDGQPALDIYPESNKEKENLKSGSTLKKVKHMQNLLKKEGFTGNTMKDNIETYEDVPAYVRKNLNIIEPDKKTNTKVSKFTLSTDGEEGPVLREDNAYLNDNVD